MIKHFVIHNADISHCCVILFKKIYFDCLIYFAENMFKQ